MLNYTDLRPVPVGPSSGITGVLMPRRNIKGRTWTSGISSTATRRFVVLKVSIFPLCHATEEERPNYFVCASRRSGVHLNSSLDLETKDYSKAHQLGNHPEVFNATAVVTDAIEMYTAGPRNRGNSRTTNHRSEI